MGDQNISLRCDFSCLSVSRAVETTFALSTADAKPVTIRALLSSAFVNNGLPFKCTVGGYTTGSFGAAVYPAGHVNKGKEDAFVATIGKGKESHTRNITYIR